jgi:serine/threonine protein kinase
MLNQQFGNYKFLSILGEGGMAIVYLAENTMLGSLVAIKVLKEDFVSNKNVRSRFLDEAKKMVKVKHPNIIQVMDLIDAGDIVAIVMEYIEGLTLKDLIDDKGKLSNYEIDSIFLQILIALQHVHEAGYVHRDIKPSNFMITKNGDIKLADFGIAKDKNSTVFTETGIQMGTPMYMSPEQIKSFKDVDLRSDIYSLGIVLYEMVYGSFPFDKINLSLPEIQVCIIKDQIPITNTKWDIHISKATAKIENDRFQSCKEWLQMFPIEDRKKLNLIVKSKTRLNVFSLKTIFIGLSLLVLTGLLIYFFTPVNAEEVKVRSKVGDEIQVSKNDLANKTDVEIEKIIGEIEKGNYPTCRDCAENFKFENGDYIYSFKTENNKIKSIEKVVKKSTLNGKSESNLLSEKSNPSQITPILKNDISIKIDKKNRNEIEKILARDSYLSASIKTNLLKSKIISFDRQEAQITNVNQYKILVYKAINTKDQKIEIWFNYDDWIGNGKPSLSSKINFNKFVSIK